MNEVQLSAFFDNLKTERRCSCGRFFETSISKKINFCPECEREFKK